MSMQRIYIPEENVYGEIVRFGAYVSTVQYTKLGMEYEVMMENTEFVLLEEEDVD